MSRQLVRWGVVIAVILMVAVPTVALFEPRPARFGWQMFTAMAPDAVAWTEDADGSLEPVDLDALLVHARPEADLTDAIAAKLCAGGDVRAVVIETFRERRRIEC